MIYAQRPQIVVHIYRRNFLDEEQFVHRRIHSRHEKREEMKTKVVSLNRGKIRLYYGDCLDVLRKMKKESVDTVLADPPYGIKYRNTRGDTILNDDRPFIWWLHDAFRITRNGGALLCFCRWDVGEFFKSAIQLSGFVIRSQVIWDRQFHGMGDTKKSFAPQHDIIWFATKGNFVFPAGRPSSVFACRRPTRIKFHPTEKPVDLMTQLLNSVAPRGGRVLDPFMGSGSSALACKQLDLRFVGIEKEPRLFRTAHRRLVVRIQRGYPAFSQDSGAGKAKRVA
jgi:DNA modification methylase